MKKVKIVAVVVMSVGVIGSVHGAWEFQRGNFLSGNINLVTDYVFRGVSQTDGNPAVQGGFDYTNTDYSLYAGVWASNVDSNRGVYLFTDEVSGAHALSEDGLRTQLTEMDIDYSVLNDEGITYYDDNVVIDVLNAPGYEGASMETDFYLGWAPTVETNYGNWNFDLGYKRYEYFNTDNSDYNTNEFHGSIGFDYFNRVQFGYTANYSDEYFGLGTVWYHDLRLNVPLDEIVGYPGFNFHANYGMTDYQDNSVSNFDYDDYGVGVNYKSEGWMLDLSWVDRTDKDSLGCGSPFKCESKAVFSIGRSF